MTAVPQGDGEGHRRALALVWRALSRRDHSVAEVRLLLDRRGVEPDEAARAIEEVIAAGYLDDAVFARRFAEDRRRIDEWGGARIARALEDRGVPAELVEDALGRRTREAELEAACVVLAARFPCAPQDNRSRQRAFSFLVRRGYEPELAYEALRRHETSDAGPREADDGAGRPALDPELGRY